MTVIRLQWLLPLLLLPSCSGQGISLAGGRFQTTTDVSSWAQLANDAADMRESEDKNEIRQIYENGKNAVYTAEDGSEAKHSFASLSLQSYPLMAQDPLYNLFRHAFLKLGNEVEGEELGQFDNKPVKHYADTLVHDLFALNVKHIETEAALITGLWMRVVHELYDVLRGCQNNDGAAMNAALDRAAAMWIGVDQPEGVNDAGNLLYNLAQVAAERFNQANGEARANKLLLDSMNNLQAAAKSDVCSKGEEGFSTLRKIVNNMIGYMTIPLVQILIHHIQQQPADGGSNFIELYALSIAPRFAACAPDVYQDVLDLMVFQNMAVDDKEEAIITVQDGLSCLQLTCKDIGSYQSGAVPECDEDDILPDGVAAYAPNYDVAPYAYIDRDILQVRILTRTRAYEAALDYYKYGFNVKLPGDGYISLQDLATSNSRSVVPQFNLFKQYFGNENYADSLITNILRTNPPFDVASDNQLTELVAGYLTDMVMYMAVLQKMYEASEACVPNGDSEAALRLVDQAAAYYVGSIEGEDIGGLDGGQLLYATSKQLCGNFTKCVQDNDADNNQRILAAFDEISNEIVLGTCGEAKKSVEEFIVPLMPVPLVQGALHYAVENAKLQAGSKNAGLGKADAFAFSIVPFVDGVDNALGTSLLTNLQFRPELSPVSEGPAQVFDTIKATLPAMKVDCRDIGTYPTFGTVCPEGGAPLPTASPDGSPTEPQPTPTEAPAPTPPSQPEILGFGRYEFTYDNSIAALALDVRDMRNAASIADATGVYTNGKNANVETGGVTSLVSLASLSTNAQNTMAQDIDFNLFRFALATEDTFSTGDYLSASTYADTATTKAFTVADDSNLAAEATVILHVWMQVTNYFHEAIRACDAGGNAVAEVDKAVALYLGLEQTEASDDTGYLLYSIAEKADTRFGHEKDSEARINTELLDYFNQAKTIAADCPTNPDKFVPLRDVVSKITRAMSFPLVQNLLYFINEAQKDAPDYLIMENFVELYALSVVPRLIGCNPTAYFYLQNTLIDNDFDTSKINKEFTSHMQSLQKCFGVKCIDLRPHRIQDNDFQSFVQDQCYHVHEGSIVGYTPATDILEYLNLDQDIVQIGILAETEAFDAAEDMYEYGYNSHRFSQNSKAKTLSLKSLATDPERAIIPEQFILFSQYYGWDSFGDQEIVSALQQTDAYASASVQQRREVVIRMLQCHVSYMAVLTNLFTAVDKCDAGQGGLSYWDRAVALFVGSIEGEIRGGDPNGYGELMYSLGKETCDDFGSCEGNTDSSINEALLESFTDGLSMIADKNCESAEKLIKTNIVPKLPVPLIQGTLFYSTIMEDLGAGTQDDELATGYVLSRSILPLVDEANSTSSATIDSNMDLQFDSDPVSQGSDAIFDAITYALPGMNVNCKDIGSFNNRSVCSPDLKPHSSTPTDMGDGLYTTTTYVQDRANIALDVKAIRSALEGNSVPLAKEIYIDGQNSDLYNENGIKIGSRSLSSFSTNAPTEMADEPIYNIFRFALQDDQGLFLGNDVGLYADTLVNEAFDSDNPMLAADAVVVYNVWMYLVHELSQTLHNCKNKTIVDMDGIHSIDEAVAYWIGDGQITGDPQQGHLLYALAEQMGERFGLDESGQVRTNRNILGLFNQAKLELSLPTACSDNPESFPRLYEIVNKIVSWMTIPLVQGLIHSLRENEKDYVKLYARAVLPLVAGCSNATYTELSQKLFKGDYNVVEVDNLVARLETTYECLGFTCADVGMHESQDTQTCQDTAVLNPLAGYVPETDVRAFALIDLDIYQANILMQMGAYGAVEDLYSHGKHALIEEASGRQTLSLYDLAITSQRSVVPQFDSFIRYFETDRYADVIIRRALDTSQLPLASSEQRREMVVKGMQYLVLYMASLQQMHQSVADCKSADAVKILDAEEAWDRAAAYLIGSAEGPDDGGTSEGQSFYALARKRCDQFNTCTEPGRASWNDELISRLYTGRGSVLARACGELHKTVTEIEKLLLVPLIQGTLRYAIENAKLPVFTENGDLAEGFIFSRSVLPLVEDANRDSAETISTNMEFQFEMHPVPDGPGAVWSAFAKAYGPMGVQCELVGETDAYDACTGATAPSSGEEGKNDNIGMIVGIVVGVLALLAIVALFYFDRRRKRIALEDRPSFVAPKGELNHTPDRLIGSTYSAGEEAHDDEEAYPAASPTGETAPLDTSQDSNGSFTID